MTQDKLSEDALGKLVARCETMVHGVTMNDAEALRLCAVTIASVLPDAKAELLALRSATPMPGVKVLEWFPVEAICTREKAQALGGHYSVVEFDKDRPDRHFATNIDLGGLAFVFLLEPDMEFGGTRPKRFSTIEAAKAAAQADYEARILASIQAKGE
jgi:hypothetical protein